jgi:hypothetical protein
MNKKKKQSLTILLGIFLSLVIVCSNLFQFENKTFAKKEVKKEQNENKNTSNEETLSILPAFSLPTSAQVHLTLQSYCLFEISFRKSNDETHTSEIQLHPEKLLQTLFSVIIAPNAP